MTNENALDALCNDILAHGVPSATLGAYADEVRRECAEVRMKQLIAIYEAGYDMGKYVLESIKPNKPVTKLPPSMEKVINSAIMGKEACKTCGRQCPNDCPMDKE